MCGTQSVSSSSSSGWPTSMDNVIGTVISPDSLSIAVACTAVCLSIVGMMAWKFLRL